MQRVLFVALLVLTFAVLAALRLSGQEPPVAHGVTQAQIDELVDLARHELVTGDEFEDFLKRHRQFANVELTAQRDTPADFTVWTDGSLVADGAPRVGNFTVDFFAYPNARDSATIDSAIGVCDKRVRGGEQAAFFLARNRDLIPVATRPYVLIFPGTIRRTAEGQQMVLYLSWEDSAWFLWYRYVADEWRKEYRIVRFRE